MQQQGSTFNEGWTFVWKGFLTTLGTSILQPLRTLLEKPTPNYEVNVTPVPLAVTKWQLLLSVLPSFLGLGLGLGLGLTLTLIFLGLGPGLGPCLGVRVRVRPNPDPNPGWS